jgi:hypothetical protein
MNQYQFWTDSLAWLAGPRTGPRPAIINEQPECGFYRMKRGTSWVPVAVWPMDALKGGLGFKIGKEVVGNSIGTEQWHWYAAHPITEAEYRKVAERGENWSDADPTVAAMQANGNAKPAADPVTELREEITTAVGGIAAYAKIETDEDDVRALSLRNMLNELASTADKARETEKAPHLKAEREIDAKWQPLIKQAREGARKIKEARDQWQDDKRAAARAAIVAAEAATRAQEEASGHRDISEMPLEPVKPVSNLPAPSTSVKPAYGKASSVGTKMVVTAIDWDKMIAALKPRPEWPTLQAFLQEMAQKLANKGIILDGVSVEERANTR